MKNIKTILIMLMAVIIVGSFAVLTTINYISTEKTIKAELEKSLTSTAQSNAKEASLWIDLRRTEMEALASSPILASGNKQAIISYLTDESKRLPVFSAFWVSDLNGTWYSPTGTSGSITERSYFKEISASQKTIISDPLIGKADGKMACVVAVPIKVNGKMVGILGGNVKMDEIVQHIGSIKVGQTGYATLAQRDGLTIAHPNQEYIMKYNPLQDSNIDAKLKAIYQQQSLGDTGIAHYTTRGVDQYIAYTPIPGLKWTLNITATAEEFMGPLQSLVFTSIATAIIILIIAIALVVMLVQRMVKPLKILQEVAEDIAKGDLSVTDLKISAQNEFGRLAKSFEEMVVNLRGLIGQVTNAAEQVAASSQQLSASANQSAQASNHVAATITNVAADTERQLTAAGEASNAVAQMSEKIAQVAAHTNDVVNEAEKTASAAHNGSKAVEVVINQMNNIENTVIGSAQVVEKLGERSKEIGQIVDTISGIAGQTNLLALNAAIEAARAGEQGKGFAVVAEEVRKLAEQSHQAAMQIADLIKDIQDETAKAVVSMNEGTKEVKVGSEVVATTGESFKEITQLIDEVSHQVKEISVVVKDMTKDSHQIVSSVSAIENVTKNTADETQVVSASTQEQSASMEEIASASSNLSELAENLQVAINKFKL